MLPVVAVPLAFKVCVEATYSPIKPKGPLYQKACGYIRFAFEMQVSNEDFVPYINEILIKPEYRRNKLIRILLCFLACYLVNALDMDENTNIYLDAIDTSSKETLSLIKLYKSFGFHTDHPYYNGIKTVFNAYSAKLSIKLVDLIKQCRSFSNVHNVHNGGYRKTKKNKRNKKKRTIKHRK